MHSLLELIRSRTECRTPIVVYEDDCGNDRGAAVDRVKRISLASDTHLDVLHCEADDQLVMIGKKIDSTIINGDWLLLTFGPRFTVSDFLRLVGRRLFTIMPDIEKKPNIELFRLWLCLGKKHVQPAVFRQIAVEVNLRDVHSAAAIDSAARRSPPPSAASAQTAQCEAAPSQKKHDLGLPPGVGVEDYEAIPVDDSAGDADTAFDAAQQFTPPHHDSPPRANPASKVGVMFYRRLELATGKRPTSSAGRAAELRQLRHSANPLRQPPKHPLRPLTAGEASPSRRPAHDAEARVNPAVELRAKFEKRCSDALQELHTLLLRSYSVSQESGERLLQLVETLSHAAPTADLTAVVPPVASVVDLPSASPKDLQLSDVLREAEGMVTRLGVWAGCDVLVQQFQSDKFTQVYLDLARIQFSLRHPTIFSPLALVRENSSSEYTYLLFPKPAIGPVPLVLRKLDSPANLSLQYVAAVARCVALALSQLHTLGVVHRDVTASNVMDMGSLTLTLAITNRCRRCDPVSCTAPNDGVAVRWTSPDALFTQRYAPSDDVWALGVLLWEVLQLCREAPFSVYVLKEDVASALARGEVPSRPAGCPEHFWRRIVAPCFLGRARRPQLSQIVAEIDAIMVSL